MGSFSIWHWIIVIGLILRALRPRQGLRADGRRGQGHQELQEGHGRGRDVAEPPRRSPHDPGAADAVRAAPRTRRRSAERHPAGAGAKTCSTSAGARSSSSPSWRSSWSARRNCRACCAPSARRWGRCAAPPNDFKRQFDEALREAEREVDLEDTKKQLQAIADGSARRRAEGSRRDDARRRLRHAGQADASAFARAARSRRATPHEAEPLKTGALAARAAGATRHDARRHRGLEGAADRAPDRAAHAADARRHRDLHRLHRLLLFRRRRSSTS